MTGSDSLPRWDLGPIFPGFDSSEYLQAKEGLAALSSAMLQHLEGAAVDPIAAWLSRALELEDQAGSLYETLGAYAYARYSTATRDPAALAQVNAVEELGLPLKRTRVLFRNALAARRIEVEALLASDPGIAGYAFHLKDELFWQAKQMSPELEDLAEDLGRSGSDAWGRLQEAISSNASVLWDAGTGERKTLVELRNLASDEDRALREKAWRLELEALKAVELPLAAALNGVKGFAATLDGRRGWKSALEKSTEQARVSPAALEALLSAMEDSLPVWRRYLKAKARLLGVEACAFFDLFGPVGGTGRKYSFDEARDLIVAKFRAFDPAMGDFAARAFRERWIDAEPREGKVGGAYCIDFPYARTTRVLCNFDGTFSGITTIAHELGHAWHAERVREEPYVYTQYPMTLAETASIFAETVVFEDALRAAPASEKLGLLELHLQDACQVIVDILSRFRFERAVFERRVEGELSSGEFCALMTEAQKATYGDGLDPGKLHPYMWAVKGHYYSAGLSFYNFPYAFGLLFAMGLFARYLEEGPSFAGAYNGILRETGKATAVDVTSHAGFDIESLAFWKKGCSVFERQVEEFEKLVDAERRILRPDRQ